MGEHEAGVENATAALEPECQNWTAGNCSALSYETEPPPPGALMIGNLMLYGLICAAGTVGNGLVIYVVLRSVMSSCRIPNRAVEVGLKNPRFSSFKKK